MGPYHFARMRAFAEYGGVDLHVVESTSQDDHQWVRSNEEMGFSHVALSSAPLSQKTLAEVARDLQREVAKYRPDILVASGYTGGTPWKLLRRFKREGGTVILWSESTRLDRRRAWWREVVKSRLVRRFDGAFVAGQPQRRYLRELGMRDEQIGVVGGVIENQFFSEAAQRCRVSPEVNRKALHLPEDYFLYVGRFIPEKNLLSLLRAYKRYRRCCDSPKPWDLVLVGGGNEGPSLRQFVEREALEGVHWAGIRQAEELGDYYALARCFVLPSTSEPWGLVVNEAMAASLPVVVSDRCGCVEDLVEDGVNGFVFNCEEDRELTERLRRVSGGAVDLKAMGRRSYERVQDFSPRRYAERLGTFLAKIHKPAL